MPTGVPREPDRPASEPKMTRLHQQIETRLPLDAAFAFVADFANATRWDPGVATSEPVDDRPVGLGARYRLGVRMRGRVTPMEYWITEFDAPRRVVLTGTGPGVSAVDEIRFDRAGTVTRIDYAADIRLGGLLRIPGGLCPSLAVMEQATRRTSLRITGVDDVGPHYVRTLRAWRTRFMEQLSSVRALGFDDRFVRT